MSRPWKDDDALSDEEFFAMFEATHGASAASVAKKAPEPRRRKQVAEVVGEKPKKRKAIPVPKKRDGVSWRERDNRLRWPDGYEGPRNGWSGLPSSGAPRPPKNPPKKGANR